MKPDEPSPVTPTVDEQMIEQTAASMSLAQLMRAAWRDRKKPKDNRPLDEYDYLMIQPGDLVYVSRACRNPFRPVRWICTYGIPRSVLSDPSRTMYHAAIGRGYTRALAVWNARRIADANKARFEQEDLHD